MRSDIYQTLDAVSEGVRVRVEFQPKANYSLTTSGIPFLRAITVHNETAEPLEALDVSATLSLAGDEPVVFRVHVPGPIPRGGVARIDDERGFAVFSPVLAHTSERTPGTLDITADVADSRLPRQTRLRTAVEASAANEWLNFSGMHAALASFVQPGTFSVTKLLHAASTRLLEATGSATLDGYQGGPARAVQIAGAVYEAVRALDISYQAPGASFSNSAQTVRTTERVVRDGFGTSVDLSVLYAACLEAVGLFPVIVVTREHTIAGFHTGETYGAAATLSDVNVLANMVETGLVHVVDLGGVASGADSQPFTAASAAAKDDFRLRLADIITMVDVTRARLDGIRPMPGIGTDDVASAQQLADDRPFVAAAAARTPESVTEAEVVRGVLERDDESPARFRNWKRDLLDLTLRNPLLNLPSNLKTLDLLVPSGMLSLLDDAVHTAKPVRVLGGTDSTELQKLAGMRVASDVSAASLTALFETHRTVFSALDDDKHRKQLRAMKREADTLEQESGSNFLYLTLGTLVHSKADGSEARAPLFILPVRLTGGMASSPFSMTLDGEELAQPNLCLLQWLKTTRGVDLTALSNPSLDDSGLAVTATLGEIRRQLVEADLPYRIDETASLAILRFSTFQIWKDLDSNWRPLMENPVVRHLVETPGETFVDPAGSGELMVDETSLRLPIAADGSQMAAIVRATSGQSFVLEGPPGTGKSQTITNLIAHALTAGKKVLFVAEKQAALEVVKRRLDAIGLGTFGLELHGAKQSMNSIREQLRAALGLRVASDARTWETTDARLRSAIVELSRYPELVHEQNAHGYSLWTAYDALGTLGEGPAAVIPPGWVSNPSPIDVPVVTRDLADAAIRLGLKPGYRWLLCGHTDPASLDLDALRAALTQLASARALLAELSPSVTAALPELLPGAGLPRFDALLTAAGSGALPTADERAIIATPSWRSAAEALQGDVADFRAAHSSTLDRVTTEAFALTDLDELLAQAQKLDAVRVARRLRRAALRKRVTALLRPGTEIDDAELSSILQALRAATTDAAELRTRLTSLTGLRGAGQWTAFDAEAPETLRAAITAAQNAVWLAQHAPTAWRLLGEASPSPRDAELVRQISTAWSTMVSAAAANPGTVRQWASTTHDARDAHGTGGSTRNWLATWTRDEALWLSDLDTTGLLQPQRFSETRRLLTELVRAGLPAFSEQLATASIPAAMAEEALQRGMARASLAERSAAGDLGSFDGDGHDSAADAYLRESAALRQHLRTAVAARLIAQRPFDAENLHGEVAELARQIERKRGGLAFREVARRYPRALTSITPCFLMSPGSVAHFLDADSIQFDLVVFDEASQIRVPQAIGAMGRGKSVIVVGDSRQMPPTRIMQVDAVSETDTSAEDVVVEDLESILTESVESGLPQLWLNWHYRSQDESLIAFSNATYYQDKLVSLPSPRTADNTGLSWRRVSGLFDRGRSRTNTVEADAIVDEIRSRLADPATATDSLGVVCFNIQQRDLILNKLEDSGDPLVHRALSAPAGSDLFVKNLENVQGDERDTILFSLAFSLDPASGRLPLNFGPLSLSGGERRLNVAVTRARKQIVLFSSFDPSDIDLSRSSAQGIADLKHYLEFAATRTLIRRERQGAVLTNRGRLIEEIAAHLVEAGYEVETELGMSSFRVDLAVRDRGATEWRLAVMVDGPGWASRPTVSDRDGSPRLLVDLMGWPALSRVWLPEWLRDRDGVLAELVSQLQRRSDKPADRESEVAR